MNKVDFSYSGTNYIVQCNNEDKMKDIINKFINKCGNNNKNLYYLYNGQIMNEELIFDKCVNSLDKSRNYMNILVIEGQEDDDINLKKSNNIICPKCNENAFIYINDFKIIIYGCKNGHKIENIKLNEFENTQYIDQSKIKCNICEILKNDIKDNKLYICYTCKYNLCPKCKDIHDKSHNNIIDYDDNQYYCNKHYNEYKYYCNDCKQDLCITCKNEHQNHDIITFKDIVPDIKEIKKTDLSDTKEKIYELKTTINNMINQFNNLNRNLDTYFEIDNNIISNFDKKKRNYSTIQNVNIMKKHSDNFIVNLSEIIKNDNSLLQFGDIMNLQVKMDFDKNEKEKNNNVINIINDKKPKLIEKTNNHNIYNIFDRLREKLKKDFESSLEKKEGDKIDNNEIDDDNDDNLESKYNPSDYKYENFQLNQIKELQTFTSQNYLENLSILNDGRIFTVQYYCNQDGKKIRKICIYSITQNGYVCDINDDIEIIRGVFVMEDGKVILFTNNQSIKIIKVNKDSIKEIWKLEDIKEVERISNKKFLIFKKENADEVKEQSYFYKTKYYIYSYDKGRLILENKIHDIYINEGVKSLLYIKENEYILCCEQKGKIYGKNDVLIFYDLKNNTKIKTVKLGNSGRSILHYFGEEHLLVERNKKLIVVDINKRKIEKELDININLFSMKFIQLNEKVFFFYNSKKIFLYELDNSKSIILKEEKDLECSLILKYPGNKLIIQNDNAIAR